MSISKHSIFVWRLSNELQRAMQDRLTELYPLRDATASTTTTSTTATYDTPPDATAVSNKQQQQQQANRLLSSKAAQEQARLKLRSSQVPSWARTGKLQQETVAPTTPLTATPLLQQATTGASTDDDVAAMIDMTSNVPMIMPPAPPTQAQLASLHSSSIAAQQSPVVAVSSIKSKVGSRWAQRANQQQQQQQQQAVLQAATPTVSEVAGCAELVVSSIDTVVSGNSGANISNNSKSPQYTPPASLERLRPTTSTGSTAANAVKALIDHQQSITNSQADSNNVDSVGNADVDDGDMYESDFEFEHDPANDSDKVSDSKQESHQPLSPQYTPVIDLEMSNDDHINFDEVSAIFDVADVNNGK
jgi:hypothetical protein